MLSYLKRKDATTYSHYFVTKKFHINIVNTLETMAKKSIGDIIISVVKCIYNLYFGSTTVGRIYDRYLLRKSEGS